LTLAIRRHERRTDRRRTPIVALSANVMRGEPEQTRAAGMDDFMAKPTTIPFLAGKLRHWLPALDWEAPAVEAEAVTADEPPIDAAALDLLTAGDEALARSVLDDFLDTTGGDLEALRAAIADRRAEDARRSAHRIKGAALTVGARPMARLAQEIEDGTGSGADPDWIAVAAAADRLTDALAATAAAS